MVTTEKILETMNSWHWGELIVECSKRCFGGSSRSTVQWPTSASLTSHQSNVGNELLPGNNFHSLIVFKLKPLPNSKFYHKHFMLKHNKLKHLFYTNICGVLKLFFVLLSNKFFCFFWTEKKLRDLLKNWNQSQNYAINLHWLIILSITLN